MNNLRKEQAADGRWAYVFDHSETGKPWFLEWTTPPQPLTHNRARRSIWHAALIFSALSWLAIGALSSSVVFAQGDKRIMRNELPYNVGVFHDAERSVTCWTAETFHSIGISCLPDSQIGGAK